eukprot:4750158-Pleurochrysis_carterae.AAC.1
MLRNAGKEAFAAAASAFRAMLASPIIIATRPPSFVADNSPATAVLDGVDKMLACAFEDLELAEFGGHASHT